MSFYSSLTAYYTVRLTYHLALSTGATGYIGGDALFALYSTHPEYEYTALVRDSDRGAAIAASYPSVRMIYGTLEDSAVLEEASSKADVVLRMYNHQLSTTPPT
jgi:N-acetyl-gamma-glutamylphosphate reductase